MRQNFLKSLKYYLKILLNLLTFKKVKIVDDVEFLWVKDHKQGNHWEVKCCGQLISVHPPNIVNSKWTARKGITTWVKWFEGTEQEVFQKAVSWTKQLN